MRHNDGNEILRSVTTVFRWCPSKMFRVSMEGKEDEASENACQKPEALLEWFCSEAVVSTNLIPKSIDWS